MTEEKTVPPNVLTELDLSEALGEVLGNALVNRRPVAVAYVGADGKPHLSYRGTTQRLDAHRLAIWVRNPGGGIVRAISERPTLALIYSDFTDPARRVILSITGRGRVEPDEAVRRLVFDASPEIERNQDPERKGVAIVIDVDEVNGVMDGKFLRMRRG